MDITKYRSVFLRGCVRLRFLCSTWGDQFDLYSASGPSHTPGIALVAVVAFDAMVLGFQRSKRVEVHRHTYSYTIPPLDAPIAFVERA